MPVRPFVVLAACVASLRWVVHLHDAANSAATPTLRLHHAFHCSNDANECHPCDGIGRVYLRSCCDNELRGMRARLSRAGGVTRVAIGDERQFIVYADGQGMYHNTNVSARALSPYTRSPPLWVIPHGVVWPPPIEPAAMLFYNTRFAHTTVVAWRPLSANLTCAVATATLITPRVVFEIA